MGRVLQFRHCRLAAGFAIRLALRGVHGPCGRPMSPRGFHTLRLVPMSPAARSLHADSGIRQLRMEKVVLMAEYELPREHTFRELRFESCRSRDQSSDHIVPPVGVRGPCSHQTISDFPCASAWRAKRKDNWKIFHDSGWHRQADGAAPISSRFCRQSIGRYGSGPHTVTGARA